MDTSKGGSIEFLFRTGNSARDGTEYWDDGESDESVSHQVEAFFRIGEGIYAIEGLAHMGPGDGSVIRLEKTPEPGRWKALPVATLPSAPRTVSVTRDEIMLITLATGIAAVGLDGQSKMLLETEPGGGLNPNSSVLSADERKLYLGMNQYVGEFDLATKKLRYLIPSAAFLNRLSKEDEARVRGH